MHPRCRGNRVVSPQSGGAAMHPCGPGLCQPVQKTGVVALQFCGVSKADIQGSQAEREGPCRRRGEAVPIGAADYISAQHTDVFEWMEKRTN